LATDDTKRNEDADSEIAARMHRTLKRLMETPPETQEDVVKRRRGIKSDAAPEKPKAKPSARPGTRRASSLAQDRIYIERVVGGYPAMELMLKDCRDGDVVAVWAPDVFGPGANRIIDEIHAKGASVAYAVKENANA